jgi:RNA polymerase sigma factor (sigma-70 family)
MNSAQTTIVLRHLRRLGARHPAERPTDAELLQRFTACRDGEAFAELVGRHGAMVLGVCRSVLGHEQDAEDAFQATFLVLARQAGSIRHGQALPAFLYEVAHRASARAQATAVRWRARDKRAGERAPSDPLLDMTVRDLQRVVHEELRRLPEKYRLPIVLCYLDGHSQEEAALRLGLPKATLRGRLDRGREHLRRRLVSRGVAPAAALAADLMLRPSPAPAALIDSALQSGCGAASLQAATLASEVIRALVSTKLRLAAVVLLAASLAAGAVALGRQAPEAQSSPSAAELKPAQAAQADFLAASEAPLPNALGEKHSENESQLYRGRVVGPDGKPIGGAKVYLTLPRIDLHQASSAPVRATTQRDGRFEFRAKTGALGAYGALLVATAAGFGPGRVAAQAEHELTLQLAKDDIPVAGRVVDLQGRPVRGATIRVLHLRMALHAGGDDLTGFLPSLEGKKRALPPPEYFAAGTATALRCEEFPTLPQMVTTDATGRFQLRGIGRERMAVVLIEGPQIATQEVRILTRQTQARHILVGEGDPSRSAVYYGAAFTHVAVPGRTVVGVVRDRDTQKPLRGIRVRIDERVSEPSCGKCLAETTTDSDGRYQLVGVPKWKGIWVVASPAKDAPYLGASKRMVETEGLVPAAIDFDLKRGVWIDGRVTDAMNGKPPQCMVCYNVFENNPHFHDYKALFFEPPMAMTGDDGCFRLLVLPGRGLIGAGHLLDRYRRGVGAGRIQGLNASGRFNTYPSQVAPREYHSLVEVNPAADAQSITCNIVLEPGRTLKGKVLDEAGEPLAGARVRGLTPDVLAYSDPLKTAEFELLALEPDRARLVQFAHFEKGLTGFLVVRPEDKTSLSVRLGPPGALSGRMVNKAGRPLADVEIAAFFSDPPLARAAPGDPPPEGFFPGVRSGKDGRFRIDGLATGLRFHLVVTRGFILYDPEMAGVPTVQPGQTKDLGDLRVAID